jgi:hypothetical protein
LSILVVYTGQWLISTSFVYLQSEQLLFLIK